MTTETGKDEEMMKLKACRKIDETRKGAKESAAMTTEPGKDEEMMKLKACRKIDETRKGAKK